MHNANNVAVYTYHHVLPAGGALAVTHQCFESQIRGLAENGYRCLSAHEFAGFLAGEPAPKKSVVLTFDDGYLDNWVYAHPVLKRYGMKAILFGITGFIGEGPARPHAGQGRVVPFTPSHYEATKAMYGGAPDSVMLRWSEIAEMLSVGTFELHSHTHTHTRWDLVCSSAQEKIERLHEDVEASRRSIISKIGAPSSHLCWPQGYFDSDYLHVAKVAGFDHLYTTDPRGQNKPGNATHHIYRVTVRNRPYAWLRQRHWLATHPTWGPAYNRWKAAK